MYDDQPLAFCIEMLTNIWQSDTIEIYPFLREIYNLQDISVVICYS